MRNLLPHVVFVALCIGGCAAAERPDRLIGAGEASLRREWGNPEVLGESSGDESRYGPWGSFTGYEWPSSRISYYIYPKRNQSVEVQHGRVLAIRPIDTTERYILDHPGPNESPSADGAHDAGKAGGT